MPTNNVNPPVAPIPTQKNYLLLSWVIFGISFGLAVILVILQVGLALTPTLKVIINIVGYLSFGLLIIGVLSRLKHFKNLNLLTTGKIIKNLIVLIVYIIFYYSMVFIVAVIGLGLST